MVKRIILLLTAVILMLNISACVRKDVKIIAPDNTADEADVGDADIVKKITFDERVEEFNKVYKQALLLTGQENAEEAVKKTKEANNLWMGIFNDFVNNQPKEYRKTGDWIERMKSLSGIAVAAENFAQNGELKEAHEKLEMVRKNIREIREENNIKNISSEMLVFHDIMEELILIDAKAGAENKIVELKIAFAALKAYNNGNSEYEILIKKMEKVISEVDNSSEDIFKEKAQKLKPIFIELYMQFG